MKPKNLWRGYVNQVLYPVNFNRPIEDNFIARVADSMIHQEHFMDPVATYYQAMTDALASGEQITDAQNEVASRDYLTKLLRTLDERKPWAELPFRQEDDYEMWPAVHNAPVIAHIPLTMDEVEDQLDRVFDDIDGSAVMILRLRTGQLVALVKRPPLDGWGIDLQAHTDPKETIAAFRKLTKLKAKSR